MIVKLHFQCLFLNIEITKLSFFSFWCQYPLFLLNRRGKTELDTWLFFFQKNKAYPLFPFSFLIHAFWSFLVWINITCFNLSVPRPPARPSWAGNLTWLQQSSTPAGLVGIRSCRFVFFFYGFLTDKQWRERGELPTSFYSWSMWKCWVILPQVHINKQMRLESWE